MMNIKAKSAENYANILVELDNRAKKHLQKPPCLVAVSKTFAPEDIRPVISAGARVFGENRVQEAHEKWPALKKEFPKLELHLIGPLQSNKTSEAVALFDCIQTVDRKKIAKAIAREMTKQDRHLQLFVQVNTGNEPQKAGIRPEETREFCAWCREDQKLDIAGLMCIPPVDENPGPHFALLRELSVDCGVNSLSMGMSSDYLTAVEFGATHVRVGSAIFGAR
ncbi:MAG: YggS family pyridoxal phosphate-dependent enzyme [Rhizobiaceae bacterium]